MRKHYALGVITGFFAAVALAALFYSAHTVAAAKRGTIIASSVVADQFVLSGPLGQPVAFMSLDETGLPRVVLADKDQKPRLMLSLVGENADPRVALFNRDGIGQIVTELKGREPVMSMINRENSSQLILTINDKTGAYFSILDQTALRAAQVAAGQQEAK